MKKSENYPTKEAKELFKGILKLKTSNEAVCFFRDLLTIKEIEDFSTRFKIARLLQKDKLTYKQIAKKCKVSTTTVTRVAHWLNSGMGGYKLVIKRLKSSK